MTIVPVSRADYPAMIDLWEASVRASHHFLPEAEILALSNRLFWSTTSMR